MWASVRQQAQCVVRDDNGHLLSDASGDAGHVATRDCSGEDERHPVRSGARSTSDYLGTPAVGGGAL